ncbi:L-threonylcarbamoyladenylate synthase [Paracoccus denitrificans]|jgi:L-threonylcarbamoyladenylate synthase|uniref:Threonylcarbamoyl-AMP synthase n=1 Tax=Paracoccus denitrificans (strain Pd 1222) TaxID=318586 RepID=A1AZ55_PARDP|nr:L-threonylcarbamoyladenylate synthase [Paracoccus denitrificans]ABL68549.1 translation factor SUA5 [Paracoccus denitrificans PD1222]MBB4625728.1 L-threonylcarbamoyladenylate synthase [Paracoccus denitrificans]MCU7427106.1 L-threonylcarbamoyladenylate synthase [Paracoccus denitrificans]QAR26616.1 threonylcarbamoyl-AMP synthase [Paracoccus denitrificans]UPV95563.1 L-threonylcarbamoyladenylate synthase [Paracoccus denitrificans]
MQTLILGHDPRGVRTAAELLAQGEPVAIPTETVYGLAGDARNPRAVARIYEAKGRPSFNPLIVHVPDLAAAGRIADFDDAALALARAFWPGALTLVLPLRPDAGIASLVTAGLDTVAIRVPAHPAAQEVLRVFGGPLAAPSANPSGRISPTTAAHAADPETGLGGRIAAVLDAGACPVGVESTIVGWVDGQPALLRPGGVAAEAIEAVLGRPLARPEADPDAPTAPGQLTSHYAPRASLRLNADAARPGEVLIGFGPVAGEMTLSETGDLTEAAARLFDLLHRADAEERPIAVAPVPERGLGAAINDRLRRAAAPR